MNNLTPEMQARLNLWRKNTVEVKSTKKVVRKSPGNFVARQGDWGDDFSDYEKKEAEMWTKQEQSNKVLNGNY